MERLNGTHAIVTGAAQGLGFAIAVKLVEAGAHVIGIDVDSQRLSKQFSSFSATQASTFACDIRDISSVRATLGEVTSSVPKIDILVNNAGVWTDNEMEASDADRRQVALDTNALGPIHVTETLLPTLRNQESAHIFNVISTAADFMSPSGHNTDWKTYGASKWAFNGYTKSLRESLQGTSVRVSGFFPGGIDTNLYENAGRSLAHEQPWMMDVNDVAEIAIFALTRPSGILIESLTVTKP